MDYGKLAYLKVADLEGRLSIDNDDSFKVSVLRFKDLGAGKTQIASVVGNGDIAAFINSSSSAEFFVDDIKVCEGANVFFKMNSNGQITAYSDGIEKLDIMLIGNIEYVEKPSLIQADYNGDNIAYFVCENGVVQGFGSRIDKFTPIKFIDEEGAHVDICAYQNEFLFGIVLFDGTVNLYVTSGESKFFDLGATRIALNADKYGITVAYLKNGELYYFTMANINAQPSEHIKLNFKGVIDDLKFVKKGSKILFSSGEKCFIKDIGANAETLHNCLLKWRSKVI